MIFRQQVDELQNRSPLHLQLFYTHSPHRPVDRHLGQPTATVSVECNAWLKASLFQGLFPVCHGLSRYCFRTPRRLHPKSAHISLSIRPILVPPRRSDCVREALPFCLVTRGSALKLSGKTSILTAIVGFSISRFVPAQQLGFGH